VLIDIADSKYNIVFFCKFVLITSSCSQSRKRGGT